MSNLRAVVDRVMKRCAANWSAETERYVAGAGAGAGSAGLLPAAAGLLHLAWDGGGRDAAVAAAAVMEYALDVGPRDDASRPSWVLHLWLAERTLSQHHRDYRLSGDVQHHLAAQTQGRSPDDPVAVAAVYLERPLPRHGRTVEPIEHHAARLATALPPGDLGRCSVQLRLAQAAAFRYESGDTEALAALWQWARAAQESVTPDHLEADLVGRTAVHAALTRFRADGRDHKAVDFAVRAARTALAAVERDAARGHRRNPHDVAAAHEMLALALMASLGRTMDLATVDEALHHLERFRVLGPPDDHGTYAANTASLLTGRAVLSGSKEDVARSDALWDQLQRELPPGHPWQPHIAQKRAACAEMLRLMRMLPFNTGALLRRLRPLMGPLAPVPDLPPIVVTEPMPAPGYRSPGPGPEEFASFRRDGVPDPGAVPGRAESGGPFGGAPPEPGATFTWPPGPPAAAGPPDPQDPADLAGLPAEAEAVFHGLAGMRDIPLDPRRLALAERQLRDHLADPALKPGHRGWAGSVLMAVLVARFTFSENTADLVDAVRQGDEILATLSPTSSRYIDLLCAVEDKRSTIGALHGHLPTAVRARDALRWALDRLPENSAAWLGCAVLHAQTLTHAAVLGRDPGQVRQALRLLDRSRTLFEELRGAGGPAAEFLERLPSALGQIEDLARLADAELRGDRYGVEETDVSWRPETEQLLPPAARFESARTALGGAIERRDWDLATDAAAVALEMLPLLTSPALRRDDRQAVARRALLGRRYLGPSPDGAAADVPDQLAGTSLGRTGCAVALAAGRTEQAAALLELGRAVLMSQDLEARGDVSDLAAAHPDLADAFTRLSERMHADADTAEGGEPAGVRERHAVDGQWRRLLDDIRARPGFGTFLGAPTAGQMRAEAAWGPIALINVDRLRCDALVVRHDAIRTVRLDVTEGQLAHVAEDFLTAVAVDLDAPPARQAEAAETVFTTLELLWDRIAGPVLDAAGLDEPIPEGTPSDRVPRLWWSASGPLAHLPLHAAGHHRRAELGTRRSVLDRAASSYTPGIRALRHARQAPLTRALTGPHLAVGQPTGDHGAAGVSADEIRAVARTLTGLRVLDGAAARVDTVLSALPSAATVHFACHGISDPTDPSRSRLELADGPLEVGSVVRQRLPLAQLAVLLACHTARTDRLPDEAIHLTSAFQTAGYPQVVGALWEAADLVSLRLTRHLYRSLRRYGGGLDVTDTGRALHGIVRGLRGRYADTPAVWAPYVHTGR
ncbi:CHAT domain-containing protein [Streptomyces sp. NPDC086549]|uniref:CHAT domain-containing protein n=1 Tax=Streptomyces sp. NPDC086549 TaxID=3365752 RepID=UPI0038117907